MPYQDVMGMPMRVFWMVSGFVDRIRAEEGKLALEISVAQGDGAVALHEQLSEASPNPVKQSVQAILEANKFDQAGLDALKRMTG